MATGSSDFVGETAEIGGWWNDTVCSGPFWCQRKSLQLPVITNANAATYFGSLIGPWHLAVLDPGGTDAPFQGSAGSGALADEGGQLVLAGISSWGLGGAQGCSASSTIVTVSDFSSPGMKPPLCE